MEKSTCIHIKIKKKRAYRKGKGAHEADMEKVKEGSEQ